MANIVNTEETYLKRSLVSDYILYHLKGTFYTPYLVHLTLPEYNSDNTDQPFLQEQSDLILLFAKA